jgi:hypothetical protein
VKIIDIVFSDYGKDRAVEGLESSYVWDAKFDIDWECPHGCGTNLDNFKLTARPLCFSCDEDFSWSDIISASEFERLNKLWEGEDDALRNP